MCSVSGMKTATETRETDGGSVVKEDMVDKKLPVSYRSDAAVCGNTSNTEAPVTVGFLRPVNHNNGSGADIPVHCEVTFQGDLENMNASNNYRPYETVEVGEYDWQVRCIVTLNI